MNSQKAKILKLEVGKVKMYDASHDHSKDSYASPEPKSSPIHYPMLHLSDKEAPFLEGYKVGDECTIVIKTKVAYHSSNESKSSENHNYDLDILHIGQVDHTPVGGKKQKTSPEY